MPYNIAVSIHESELDSGPPVAFLLLVLALATEQLEEDKGAERLFLRPDLVLVAQLLRTTELVVGLVEDSLELSR